MMKNILLILGVIFWPLFLTFCAYVWIAKSSDFVEVKDFGTLMVGFTVGVLISTQKLRNFKIKTE